VHPLDNPIWPAITGPQAHLAERVGAAGRFHLDVAPFSAIDRSPESWTDLATLIGSGHRALLFGAGTEPGEGWSVDHTFPCRQYVAGTLTERRGLELVDPTADDADEMVALVEKTRPGPFGKRTVEMGRYFGYREDGRLVAMAGERTRLPGYAEVSAVCTDPGSRGRGLGGELTLAVVEHIRARGDEAFLHVVHENTSAISLYESLGFVLRRDDVDVMFLKPPPPRSEAKGQRA